MKGFKNMLFIGMVHMMNLYTISPAQTLPARFHFSDDGHRLIRGGHSTTGLYNTNEIDTLYLIFSQSNYWTLLTNNYQSGTDLEATLIYKQVRYDHVGVRFKGFTSYNQVQGQKKSFNITIDYADDNQNIEGYTTLNLHNAAGDPSFLREFIYEYFNREHIPAALANYVILYINGSSWGPYVNVQQLDKHHVNEWFEDDEATRWRAEPTINIPNTGQQGDFGTHFGAGKSSLNYLNTLDTSTYKKYYTLKKAYKDNPWNDLVNACFKLSQTKAGVLTDTLWKYIDVDGALWFLAQEILFTDEDGYINKGGTDYYVYYDIATNRIIPVEYDGNSTFSSSGANTWSPFYKESNANYPLANILFSVPELRQRYLAHLRTILHDSFNKDYADSLISYYSNMINLAIKNDPKKIYTYAEFTEGVTTLKNFIANRRSYLLSNSEVSKQGPTIGTVVYKAGGVAYSYPDNTQKTTITATVAGSQEIGSIWLLYGMGIQGRFFRVEMYDDGLHDDGSSGDGCYGAFIPAQAKGALVRFYVEAIGSSSAGSRSYSPEGAEHDVYFYKVKVADMVESNVVINELMATNSGSVPDQDGEYDDWIELYNNSSIEADLSGYYLSDSENKLTKWQFPAGTRIDGNGYLIVWADKDTTQSGLHANFKLSADGEQVLFITPDVEIAGDVIFNSQSAELAYARVPNGYGPFVWQRETFAVENIVIGTGVSGNETSVNVTIYPNPASSLLYINIKDTGMEHTLGVVNMLGILQIQDSFTGQATVDVENWPQGVYLISIDHQQFTRVSVIH